MALFSRCENGIKTKDPVILAKEKIEQMLGLLERGPSDTSDFDVAYGVIRFCAEIGLLERTDTEAITARLEKVEAAWDGEMCDFLQRTKGAAAVTQYKNGAAIRRSNRKRGCV